MEERELKLPEPAVMCDCGGNYYTAEQVRQAVLAERERAASIAVQKAEGIERVNTYRGKVNQASQHAADMVRDVAAAIRKG